MIPKLYVLIQPFSWVSYTAAAEFHRRPPCFNSCSRKYPAERGVRPFICRAQIIWFTYIKPSIAFSSPIKCNPDLLPCSVGLHDGSTPLNSCLPSPCSFFCIHTACFSLLKPVELAPPQAFASASAGLSVECFSFWHVHACHVFCQVIVQKSSSSLSILRHFPRS